MELTITNQELRERIINSFPSGNSTISLNELTLNCFPEFTQFRHVVFDMIDKGEIHLTVDWELKLDERTA